MNNPDVFRSKARGIMRKFTTFVCLLCSGAILIAADTHYVSLDGTNDSVNGYITWAGAATQIQWAVDKAVASDTVLVSNGTYNLTNGITLPTAINLKSLNGTNFTFINGGYPLYTNRCIFSLEWVDAIIDGFTITNGYVVQDIGAGVVLYRAGTLRNCIVQDNTCDNTGGSGTYSGGGGVVLYLGGIVTNCQIIRNTWLGPGAGGGVFLYQGGQLLNSWIISNSAPSATGGGAFGWGAGGTIGNCQFFGNSASYGGGLQPGSTLTYGCRIYNNNASSSGGGIGGNAPGLTIDCVISNNTSTGNGGGIGCNYGCNFSNCVIVGNSASGAGGGVYVQSTDGLTSRVANCVIYGNQSVSGGGGAYCYTLGTFKNCLIYGNTNLGAGGGGFYAYWMQGGYIDNLTIVSNETGTQGGGIRLQGNNTNLVHNCLIYGNIATNDAYDDVYNDGSNSNAYYNSCTPVTLAPNQGNITNNPLFADQVNRNYRLSGNSPCINAGTNQAWMTNSVDLDGRTRIRYGAVDMGAYELIHSGTIYGFH